MVIKLSQSWFPPNVSSHLYLRFSFLPLLTSRQISGCHPLCQEEHGEWLVVWRVTTSTERVHDKASSQTDTSSHHLQDKTGWNLQV